MQDRPDAGELLKAIAQVLEEQMRETTPAPPGLKHSLRVAANLAQMLAREARLGAELDARERQRLAALLGVASAERSALELSAELSRRLDADPALARRAWPVLLEIVRGKLEVAKPGYDDFDFSEELRR